MQGDDFAREWTGNINLYALLQRYRQPVFLERNISFIGNVDKTRRKIRLDELYPRALVNALISDPPILTINITEFHIPISTTQKQRSIRCKCVLVVYCSRGQTTVPLIRQQRIATFLPLDDNTLHVQLHGGPFKLSMVDLQYSRFQQPPQFTPFLDYATYIYFFPLEGHEWLIINVDSPELSVVKRPAELFCEEVTRDFELKQIITRLDDQQNSTLVDLQANRFQRCSVLLNEGEEWVSPKLYVTITASWSKRLQLEIKHSQPRKALSPPSSLTTSWVRWHFGQDKIQQVQGFRCPVCVGRDYATVEIMEKHFNQCHDYFKARALWTKSRDIIDIHVDIDGEYMEKRASQNAPDPRVFSFTKKHKILRMSNRVSNAIIPKKRRIKTVPLVGSFYDSRTRRKFRPGEQVEESEDEIDMNWYIRKQNEELDDFSDVIQSEKDFMKLWTSFISLINPRSNQALAECLIRFCQEKREHITSHMFHVDILMMVMNLVDHRRIDPETVFQIGQLLEPYQTALEVVKDANDHWVMACCSLPWKRGDIIFCKNMECENPYYHKSCQSFPQDPSHWRCPRCILR